MGWRVVGWFCFGALVGSVLCLATVAAVRGSVWGLGW